MSPRPNIWMTSPDQSAESAPPANWQERREGAQRRHGKSSSPSVVCFSLAVTESTFFSSFPPPSRLDLSPFSHSASSYTPLCCVDTSSISLRARCFLSLPLLCVHNVDCPQPARVGLQECVLTSPYLSLRNPCLIKNL